MIDDLDNYNEDVKAMTFAWKKQAFQSSFELNTPELISVGMEDSDHRKMLRAMHVHDDRLEILLIRQGNGVHTIDGKTYHTAKGDILIYNCGAIHDEYSSTKLGMNVYSCALTNLRIKGLKPNCLVPPGRRAVVQSNEHFQEFEHLYGMMHACTKKNDVLSTEIANYLLRALVVMVYKIVLDQTEDVVPNEQELGKHIKDYIDAHYKEDINLKSIADALKVNQYYMAHVFKAMSGYSPMQYVIRRRIGEAQSYLLGTNRGITEIAMMVGYNNANHFHNTFMKIVGMSPGKYRQYWMSDKPIDK